MKKSTIVISVLVALMLTGCLTRDNTEEIADLKQLVASLTQDKQEMAQEMAEIESNIENEKEQDLFDKKMECLNQKEQIEKELQEKSNAGLIMSLEEIFYSPSENNCFYVDRASFDGGVMKRIYRVGMDPSGEPFEGIGRYRFTQDEWEAFKEVFDKDVIRAREREIEVFNKRISELKS